MNSVPKVFMERVKCILSRETLNVLQGATLGRWASAHPTFTWLWLYIALRDGKKYFCCNSPNGFLGFEDVLSLWNNATCYFEAVSFLPSPWDECDPMSGNHFDALKKMIARQRRRVGRFSVGSPVEALTDEVAEILEVCGGLDQLNIRTDIVPIAPILKKFFSDGGPMNGNHFDAFKKMIARQRRRIRFLDIGKHAEGLMENVADILKVCGGVERLAIDRDIARIAPIIKKLISDGGVRSLYMCGKPFSDWLIPTLTTQLQAGTLTNIELSLIGDDNELCESLIRMAMSHILKQEHKYYSLLHPTEYVHLHRPLEEELKYVSSKARSGETHYSHPEGHTNVKWTRNDYGFVYSWKKKHY
uniref:Elp3 domain-containing protein n=1 Tax=Steinernema glaseri TaxID=37863 RepID=A0A1I7YQK7_9BILA